MKAFIWLVTGCSFVTGCAGGVFEDELGSTEDELNVNATSGLTRKQGALSGTEAQRQADTQDYYDSVQIDFAGNTIDGPNGKLRTLDEFRQVYNFDANEILDANGNPARYYNRGDLGIGREMHCVNALTASGGHAACYVRNFAAGDDGSEFTFGMSSNIAFHNMAVGNDFATVAMVYRSFVPVNGVFFIVYDAKRESPAVCGA